MAYRQLTLDFSLQAVPLSSGALARLVRYNRDAYLGEIVTKLLGVLYSTPFVTSSALTFSLVNVTNHMSHVSAGICDTCPDEARSKGSKFTFTFALTSARYLSGTPVSSSAMRGMGVYVWRTEPGRPQYVTIGLTPFEAEQAQLGSDNMLVWFLYYAVGAMTKNIITHKKFVYGEEDYDAYYQNLYFTQLKSTVYMAPLMTTMQMREYHLWVFNRAIWMSLPGALTEHHVTAKTVLYFLLYLDRVPRVYSGAYKPLFTKMFHLFKLSYLSLAKRAASGQPANDLVDLLWPALADQDGFASDGVKQPMKWLEARDTLALKSFEVAKHPIDELIRTLFYDRYSRTAEEQRAQMLREN